MKMLAASTLAVSSLFATAVPGVAGPQADLGLDANQMFFNFIASGVNTGAFQVLPDNRYNAIVLPCDVQMFGGQVNIHYVGAGPTVFPKLTATFFDDHNRPLVSSGCTQNQVLTSESAGLAAIAAGSVQQDGFTLVDSTSPFCTWLFQPRDLPPDEVVRIHLQLAAYPNSTYQGPLVADPNLADNAHDIYVRRSCSCQ